MSSPLHKSNTWRPFYEQCVLLVSKHWAIESELLEVLQYVDPDACFPRSLRDQIRGLLIGRGFEKGRIALYWKGFEQFVKKNRSEFHNAPVKVIQEFNQLLLFLFGEKGQQLFIREGISRDASEPALKFQLFELRERRRGEETQPSTPVTNTSGVGPIVADIKVFHHPLLANFIDNEHQSEYTLLKSAYELISKSEMALNRDLNGAAAILRERYPDLAKKLVLDEAETYSPLNCSAEQLEKEITDLFQNKRKGLSDCLEQASERDRLITEVEELIQVFLRTLSRFSKYKELGPQVAALKDQFEAERVLKRQLIKTSEESLSVVLEQKKQLFRDIMASFEQKFTELESAVEKIEEQRAFIECALLLRLTEFFSGKIPYADETTEALKIQNGLSSRMEESINEFDTGKLTLNEYAVRVNYLSYDHDLLLIRQENSFRAKRLRDFRQEVLNLRYKSLQFSCFSETFIEINRELDLLYTRISNPFLLFQKAVEIEDVSRVIRGLWIEFEALQVRFEELTRMLPRPSENISDVLAQLFDDLEHVFFLTEAKSGSLMDAHSLQGQTVKGVVAIVDEIERLYPYAAPLLLLKDIEGSTQRRKVLTDLHAVEVKKRNLIELAKQCQACRVYEEERVDQLLELLEGFGKEQHREDLSNRRLKLLEHFAQELYFDFGSLDSQALQQHQEGERELLLNKLQEISFSDLFWSRIERVSNADQYAYFLLWLKRLKEWTFSVEGELFQRQRGELPSWVTPFMPICQEMRMHICAAQFGRLEKEQLQKLLESIRALLVDGVDSHFLQLIEFEKKLEMVPKERSENIFFFPGVVYMH